MSLLRLNEPGHLPEGTRGDLVLFGEGFELESGARLAPINVRYESYGRLDRSGRNVILVCHALSGDAHASRFRHPDWPLEDQNPGWWEGLIGPGRALDTGRYLVICTNFLGSRYGTTGPRSINPETGRAFGPEFPEVSVRDMVRVAPELLRLRADRSVREHPAHRT